LKAQLFNEFLARRFALEAEAVCAGEVSEGVLVDRRSGARHAIIGGIPRLVAAENYAANFGLQWNKFAATQLDSVAGIHFTFNTFWNNTGWKPGELYGKTVLEAGSGAGRFTEILLDAGARVVSFDYSSAVEANWRNNRSRGELLLFQGDIYDMPFDAGTFDFVFCYGVLQHTPDPARAFEALLSKLRPGGRLSLDYYLKVPYPAWFSTPKYLWRPITTRLSPERLFRLVSWYVPLWLPVDTVLKSVLFRIPRLGQVLAGLIPIPCWNHLRMGLSYRQRLEWAILNTFDALGARYDRPMTASEIERMVAGPGRDVRVSYGANGVVANIAKQRREGVAPDARKLTEPPRSLGQGADALASMGER
jgi:SAM-dependent methyltransferase